MKSGLKECAQEEGRSGDNLAKIARAERLLVGQHPQGLCPPQHPLFLQTHFQTQATPHRNLIRMIEATFSDLDATHSK